VKAFAATLVATALLGACGSLSEDEREAVENVLRLEFGAVNNARALRGSGPFRDYPVPPEDMLLLAEGALLTKTPGVFVNRDAREVIAKERIGDLAAEDRYEPRWVSAVIVTVHPVPLEPARSRVEVHSVQKGVFTRGSIAWERDVPPLLDAAVARWQRGLRPIED
jgi:hypothetical protein